MVSQHTDIIIKDLGDTLRKARRRANLTQAQVAADIDVHVNYYARIEREEHTPSLEVLHKIMKVLKIKNLNISAD